MRTTRRLPCILYETVFSLLFFRAPIRLESGVVTADYCCFFFFFAQNHHLSVSIILTRTICRDRHIGYRGIGVINTVAQRREPKQHRQSRLRNGKRARAHRGSVSRAPTRRSSPQAKSAYGGRTYYCDVTVFRDGIRYAITTESPGQKVAIITRDKTHTHTGELVSVVVRHG